MDILLISGCSNFSQCYNCFVAAASIANASSTAATATTTTTEGITTVAGATTSSGISTTTTICAEHQKLLSGDRPKFFGIYSAKNLIRMLSSSIVSSVLLPIKNYLLSRPIVAFLHT